MKPQAKPLLQQLRDAVRLRNYSLRTEQAYVTWVRRFILFHNPGLSAANVKRHPSEMGRAEI